MNALRHKTQILLISGLVLVFPLLVANDKSDSSTCCVGDAGNTTCTATETASKAARDATASAACGTACDIGATASNPACGISCPAPGSAPMCGVSGASCGTLTAVDFDPAVHAAAPVNGITAAGLGYQTLDALIEPVRAKYRVPALAIAVARSDGVFAAGAVGVRVAGAAPRVTVTDRFHLGSCGKAFTASVAARMVERGEIEWDTKIGDMFGDYPETAASAYRNATLEQLLAHRSGLPPRDGAVMERVRALEGDTHAQRGAFVRMALQLPPAAEPNTMFVYTDVGYTVAGAMLERAAGKSWEHLVEEHVAAPLKLTSLGFGEPASKGSMDQPWGHIVDGTRTVPFAPGPYAAMDNPAVIGPAGLIHLSIIDWGTFATDHLRGERNENGTVLAADSYRALHANVAGQNYGLGWGVATGEAGRMLTHTGSCGEWFSLVTIMPDLDLAIVTATNVSGGNAVAACTNALQAAVAQFGTVQVGTADGRGASNGIAGD